MHLDRHVQISIEYCSVSWAVCLVLFRFCVAGSASILVGVGACFGVDMVSAVGYGGGAVVGVWCTTRGCGRGTVWLVCKCDLQRVSTLEASWSMACAVDRSALGSACADFDRVLLGEQGCVCVVLFRFCVAGRASMFGGGLARASASTW